MTNSLNRKNVTEIEAGVNGAIFIPKKGIQFHQFLYAQDTNEGTITYVPHETRSLIHIWCYQKTEKLMDPSASKCYVRKVLDL